ncbi:MAG: cbb3-type cytochrome c oxidase subunit I [Caldilineales bacterium]|nr:cbb3-type cytochrome c oxidase subunit I [Caldilineales bacterium]
MMSKSIRSVTLSYVLLAIVALFVGTLFGPLQALDHARIDLYPFVRKLLPFVQSYYHGLSFHGVLNALIWTFAFTAGFLLFVTAKSLKRDYPRRWMPWLSFAFMLVGLVVTAIPMLRNDASILYTFYPPLQAPPMFYFGLVLVVVSTWLVLLSLVSIYRDWRKEHPDERTPLPAFMSLATYAMWFIASIGVATEVLALLIPWSLGWVTYTDPQLARTLFWYTGHPLVYFWLLPAYVAWYTILPKRVGGKLFSDSLARLVFLLFLLLSTPVGFHHQFTDPGVPSGWKMLHAIITFLLFVPSMLTAFTVIASIEYGGRQRGGKGVFGWLFKLPWGDPVALSMLLAGIAFLFGGIGGIVNASYNINLVVHNTSFIPGHFHLTVGTAVTLTFMGLTYWLFPQLRGRKMSGRLLAVAQVWLWFIGVMIFARGMHWSGLLGFPRRVPMGSANYWLEAWNLPSMFTAVGGSIMYVSALLYFVMVVILLFAKKAEVNEDDYAFAEALSPADRAPKLFENWRVWVGAAILLILVAYGPFLLTYAYNFVSPGFPNYW